MERKANNNMPTTKGKGNRRRRLLLFPAPLEGHINPMIYLANLLYSRGFNITIIHTKFNSPDISRYPQFTFCFIQDGLSEAESSTSDIVLLFQRLLVNCVEPFRECFINLLLSDALHQEEPVACLITDTTWYFTQELADTFNLPRIAFRTTSVSSFLAFEALPRLRDKGYLPKKGSFSLFFFFFSSIQRCMLLFNLTLFMYFVGTTKIFRSRVRDTSGRIPEA